MAYQSQQHLYGYVVFPCIILSCPCYFVTVQDRLKKYGIFRRNLEIRENFFQKLFSNGFSEGGVCFAAMFLLHPGKNTKLQDHRVAPCILYWNLVV